MNHCADAVFLRKTAFDCINSLHTNSEFALALTAVCRQFSILAKQAAEKGLFSS
jgi:hypothetical protein